MSEQEERGLHDQLRQWREQQSAVRLRGGETRSLHELALQLCPEEERALQSTRGHWARTTWSETDAEA